MPTTVASRATPLRMRSQTTPVHLVTAMPDIKTAAARSAPVTRRTTLIQLRP